MIAWNVVNLLDAEADWFVKLLIIFLVAIAMTEGIKIACRRLAAAAKEKKLLLQQSAVQAIARPSIYGVWFLVFLSGINLVCDQILAEQYPHETSVLAHVAFVLFGFWFLMRWKNFVITNIVEHKSAAEAGKVIGIGKLVSALIFVLTFLLLMEVTGQNIATLVAFGGISGLALAFASQQVISNFFGGFVIYVTHPFVVGDLISIVGTPVEGYVEDIGWYQTTLRGVDRKPVYAPNSLFTTAYVVNSSRMITRKVAIKLQLPHAALSKASSLIEKMRKLLAEETSILATEKTLVAIDKIDVSTFDLSIQAVTNLVQDAPFMEMQNRLLLGCTKIIEQEGCTLAVPELIVMNK